MSEITGPNEPGGPSDPGGPSSALPPDIPPVPSVWAPPPSMAAPSMIPAPLPDEPLRPVPFEDFDTYPTFWSRVGGMFQLVFRNPMELFERVPVTEGLNAPWRFLMLMSIPVFLLMAFFFFLMGMGAMFAAIEQAGKNDSKMLTTLIPVIFAAMLLLMPLFSFLGMAIGGALNHFFLWMWGGLKPGAGTGQSIRAYGYASAFIQLGGMIPYLGILIQLAGLIAVGMGFARLHKTDTWRGICAALTPLFLACCCAIIVAFSIPAIIAANR